MVRCTQTFGCIVCSVSDPKIKHVSWEVSNLVWYRCDTVLQSVLLPCHWKAVIDIWQIVSLLLLCSVTSYIVVHICSTLLSWFSAWLWPSTAHNYWVSTLDTKASVDIVKLYRRAFHKYPDNALRERVPICTNLRMLLKWGAVRKEEVTASKEHV